MNSISITFHLLVFIFGGHVESKSIDWKTIRPIQYYREFWADKAEVIRPPNKFFDEYRNGMHRIAGGEVARRHQFPYQALLLLTLPDYGDALCGGSLITDCLVLTAAHCLYYASNGTVILGAHDVSDDTERHRITVEVDRTSFVWHEDFDPSMPFNDIGLIKLPVPVRLIPGVIATVHLPFKEAREGETFAGRNSVVSGWGITQSDDEVPSSVLRFARSEILDNSDCEESYGPILQPTHICTYPGSTVGKGPCSGDSGGGLITKRKFKMIHTGIVSFSAGECGSLDFPDVFTRTTSFVDWILSNSNST